ncbi:HepA Superfamily II DNA/RNA helicases, SNF2 family [uncultured Caudovirales phage]|uniref:HepA Superfamily II DNA/RNA helicases, SNF2 family n=1 Tax=uncultured Caudovirales phage TaxID=2100421 RepID=A0A6J5KQI4_9CAUD|nr:HepA Superfamily II DNA/RNA helicases, SNF2 family [uncultured Caudovirales phage]
MQNLLYSVKRRMFKGTLKPYQVEAVEKMVETKHILVAYEMGLGKTPMTIAAIEQLREAGEINDLVIVLCLASLKYQWKKEIEKFSDSTALVIDGTAKQRLAQYHLADSHNYVIMNYEQIVNDWEILKNGSYAAIICDEATAIKGFKAKRAKKVKDLAKKIPIRFALTGTPIENGRPEEVFSIMQFVDSSVLGRFDLFDKTFIVRNHFGGVQRYRNLPLLHKILMEHSVRKAQHDEDVKPFLPEAIYREPYLVKLDNASQKLYNTIATDLFDVLAQARDTFGSSFNVAAHYGAAYDPGDPANELRGELMSRIGALRMLCSSPNVLMSSYTNFDNHTGKGSAYVHSLGDLLHGISKTPKLDATISYLQDHLDIDDTYKAVVFASYIDSVTEIVDRLNAKGYGAVAYTGEMNAVKKEDAKVKFQTRPHIRVLVSSDAGGYGVDLPQANLLVNYDQPWSSGLAVQRNGRINRTSSEWPSITIQDILIKDSIEQRQHDMLKQKKSVAGAILDGDGINERGGVDMSVGSLIDFLQDKLT